MMIHTIRTGHPDETGEVGRYNKHIIESEEGNFNRIVWRCRECDAVRIKGTYFSKRCPEYERV